VNDQNAGIPGNNSFVANDLDGFQSSLADIFVDAGVANTAVIGRQARVGITEPARWSFPRVKDGV